MYIQHTHTCICMCVCLCTHSAACSPCGLHAVLLSHIGLPNDALPRCRTSQYHMTFIPYQYLYQNILLILYSTVCGLAGFNCKENVCFFISLSCSLPFCRLLHSLSLLSFSGLVLWGWDLRTDMVSIAFSRPCIAGIFNNKSKKKHLICFIHMQITFEVFILF